MSAPVNGGGGAGIPTAGTKNLVGDSGLQAVPASRMYVSSMGAAGAFQAQGSAYWGFYDVAPASPAGTRALRVTTNSTTQAQGVIIYQDDVVPMTAATPIQAGQTYTVSAWVRASVAGQPMSLVARVTDASRNWRAESPRAFTSTTSWSRVSWTVTGTALTAGGFLAVQVQTAAPFPPTGTTFEVTGPQIELGPTATEYEQSAP